MNIPPERSVHVPISGRSWQLPVLLLLLLSSEPSAFGEVATTLGGVPMTPLIEQLPELPGRLAAVSMRMDDRYTLGTLYTRRRGVLLWSHAGGATPQCRALLDALERAANYGLNADDYDANGLAARLLALQTGGSASPDGWPAFDLAMSRSALIFLSDLHFGRIDAHTAGFNLPVRSDRLDGAGLLERLSNEPDTSAVLAGLEPQYVHYRLLRRALARYRVLATHAGVSSLPMLPAPYVRPGQHYAGAPALRRLLTELGDLPEMQSARNDAVLDSDLSAALRRFQFRHGLREDGGLGRETFAALTVPLAQRVRQIELTLERWHWIPPMRPPTVIVNIPQFRLFYFRSGDDREQGMLRMNVIVGRQFTYTRTPVFAADMNAIVFRPYWDVPLNITRRELLPHLRRDPGYLQTQNMELVPTKGPAITSVAVTVQAVQQLADGQLRARQRPGADNALGLIKFVLPNAYDVYLHSTPAQQLFNESTRAFSHGCIRVSDPIGLAEQVLRGNAGDWSAERIQKLMQGQATLRIPLAQPVQVLILYGTAIASEDGAVHFFRDLYGYDRRLEALLGLAPAAPAL